MERWLNPDDPSSAGESGQEGFESEESESTVSESSLDSDKKDEALTKPVLVGAAEIEEQDQECTNLIAEMNSARDACLHFQMHTQRHIDHTVFTVEAVVAAAASR